MGVSLPDDIIISIIRNHLNGRKIFCTLSLVSRSFCEIAQSALFSTVTLSHDGKAAVDKPGEPRALVDDDDDHGLPTSAVKWPKLEFLAGSDKILSYIRLLAIVLPANTHYPRSELDVYWHETVRGRSVLDALDRRLPSCLDRMSSLDILVYGGPALRGPIHQAILRHKTLQYLKTSAKTRCSVPCKEVLQRKRIGETAIEDLEFMEEGNEMDAFGFLGSGISSIGPRRYAQDPHFSPLRRSQILIWLS
ncbi:hypothetical protein FS842_007447 [Serendipita sp. 407]|nr:hypothetical protein FS842_007447 [Serendipita sp. 407]